MHGPLIGVVVALLIAGLGVPIPEDISLLGGGYLVWKGQEPLWLVMVLCFLALVAGDSALYAIGHHFGRHIVEHRWLAHKLTPARMERVRGHFAKHGEKTVFLARFVVGARALFFLTAGAMKMRYWKFLLWDGVGCVLSTVGWVLIGYFGGHQIDRVTHLVRQAEHIVGLVVALVVLTWVVTRILRRRLAGPPDDGPPTAAVTEG